MKTHDELIDEYKMLCSSVWQTSLVRELLAARDAEWQPLLDAGRELMNQAWSHFNAIRARDGAPDGVCREYWDRMTEQLKELLGNDAVPWMTKAARVLVAPYVERENKARDEAVEKQVQLYAAQDQLSALTARAEKAEGRLAEIDAGANADAEDLAKMRDGTKLTRSGVVQIIVYQQQDIAELKAKLAEVERERDTLRAASAKFLETWKRAGPMGSHQFEKFDTAVRMAEMAMEAATPVPESEVRDER